MEPFGGTGSLMGILTVVAWSLTTMLLKPLTSVCVMLSSGDQKRSKSSLSLYQSATLSISLYVWFPTTWSMWEKRGASRAATAGVALAGSAANPGRNTPA